MEPVEQLPGVTFRRESSTQGPPPPGEKCVASGRVVLSAIIQDTELWGEVVKQFECMRIYTVKNLAEQMVAVSQLKAREATKQLEVVKTEASGELEVLRQQVDFLRHENQQLREANNQWAIYGASVASHVATIPKEPIER